MPNIDLATPSLPQQSSAHESLTEPRRVFDSDRVDKGNTQVSVQSTGYYDESGFHELCATYKSAFTNTRPVLDYPPRSTHLVYSFLADWIALACLLVLLALWWAPPPKFYFRLDDPWIGYPLVDETVSSTTIVLLIVIGPIFVVTVAQIWVRSFRDWHQSVLACLTLFATTQVICTFMWTLIGGLRPDFLAFCKPDTSRGTPLTAFPGAPLVYWGDEICTCDKADLIRAKHAFPSGHAAGVVAMCVFLSIYVSAKLKLYDNRSHLWKFVFVIFFMVIALWISFSRVRDGRHHFRDVVVGMVIGAIVAPLVYRLNFCSLAGPDNHIPTRYTWTGRFAPYPFLDDFRARRAAKRNGTPYDKPELPQQYPTEPTQLYPAHGIPPTSHHPPPSYPLPPPPFIPPAPYPGTPQFVAPHTPNLPPLPMTPHVPTPNLAPEGNANR